MKSVANVSSLPQSRSPDTPEQHPMRLTDLFLVAYLETQGHRVEPFISPDGPFEHMISFEIIGDLATIRNDIDYYHDHPVLSRFLKSYKSVRNQMWTMKEVARLQSAMNKNKL